MSPMNHEIEDGYAAARAAMSDDGYASAQRQMLEVRFGEKASAVVLGERLQAAMSRLGPVGAWAAGESGVAVPVGRIAAAEDRTAQPWVKPPTVTTQAFESGDLIEDLPPDYYPDPRDDDDDSSLELPGSGVDDGRAACSTVTWTSREVLVESVPHRFSLPLQNVNYVDFGPDGSTYVVFGYEAELVLMWRRSGSDRWESMTIDSGLRSATPGVVADPDEPGVVWVVAVKSEVPHVYRVELDESDELGAVLDGFVRTWSLEAPYFGDARYPSLAVGSDGLVHVVFVAQPGGTVQLDDCCTLSFDACAREVYYARLDGPGESFTEPVQLSRGCDQTTEQAAVAAGSDGVLVVWRVDASTTDKSAAGLRYRFNTTPGDVTGFRVITSVPVPSDSDSAAAGADRLADPCAWAASTGEVFVGFHETAQSNFDIGPWLSRFDPADRRFGSTVSLANSTFRQGDFVHGAGGSKDGNAVGVAIAVGRSSETTDYDRTGLYGSVGCRGMTGWAWHSLDDDQADSESQDVLRVRGPGEIVNVYATTGRDWRGYLLELGTDVVEVGDTVTTSGAVISGRFAVREALGGGQYYLERLSGEDGLTAFKLTEKEASSVAELPGESDTGTMAVYSHYSLPNQPSIAASVDGAVAITWVEGAGPDDPFEAASDDDLPRPTVSLVLRFGAVT